MRFRSLAREVVLRGVIMAGIPGFPVILGF
jgi:hypothetical protein